MRAVFLIFLLIAFIATTMATVHHHVVHDADSDDGGTFFDGLANAANDIFG